MENAWAAVIVAVVTLLFNIGMHLFGGGWRLSSRLSSIEVGMVAVQSSILSAQDEIKKFGDILIKVADMRGELKVMDSRLTAMDTRLAATEKDIRDLRHGDGFIRGPRGIDKEYR